MRSTDPPTRDACHAYSSDFSFALRMMARKRILFFAEPATLAHVVRPVVLASALDADRFEVSVATGTDFRHLVAEAGLSVCEVWCIGTRAYLAAVTAGRVVFPLNVLQRYVDDDLRIIAQFQPDVVVGDFRLSLAVSARLARVPYLAISNAYWSPFAPSCFEIPVHASTRLFGVAFANALFQLLRPLILAQHSWPMHKLYEQYGFASLGFDLRRVFTEADITLFADVPELVPTSYAGPKGRYEYIGPITWSPKTPVPDELLDTTDPRPLVYVTLGSSGDPRCLHDIVSAAVSVGYRVAVASGESNWGDATPGVVAADTMLPGGAIAAIASLVICNGGSPSVHQALQHGTPVLGIPSNLDQMTNMHFIAESRAGLALRADQVSLPRVRQQMHRIMGDGSFTQRAKVVKHWFEGYRAEDRFVAVVSQVVGETRRELFRC